MIAKRELDIIFLILFNDSRQETGGALEVQVRAVICSVDQIFSEWLIDIFDNKRLT